MTAKTTSDRKEPQIINLDALIPETREIVLDGQTHYFEPATVDMYLEVMKRRSRMKNADTEVEQMEQGIELITRACTTISRERLGELPLRALTRLVDVIQEQMADEAEDSGDLTPEPNTDAGE